MATIDIGGASVILSVPPYLVRDFVSYEFNGRKLIPIEAGGFEFDASELRSFRDHMESAWLGDSRIPPPVFVQRYLTIEAHGVCALCCESKPNYEFAHIDPWARSRCNSPHNLLRLCLDCHRSHGNDSKLLRGVKEDLYRERTISPIYDCTPDIRTGEAVYALNGVVYRAKSDAGTGPEFDNDDKVATGLVQFKFGPDRCTVQRTDVFQGLAGLATGEKYVLSATVPGEIVTVKRFYATRGPSRMHWLQHIGHAESSTQLVINIQIPFGLVEGSD